MPSPSRYKAALVVAWLAAPAMAAERAAGAHLPDEARQVEPNRYRVEKSYEDTLKFFKTVYPPAKYRRHAIANQPGVKAVHIENPEARPGAWEGLNVYELQGETRVFVLVAPSERGKDRRGSR
ncbi:MAG: hypothetical protein ACJ79E_10785 [Anaeromyxobacteraceae bacterium]